MESIQGKEITMRDVIKITVSTAIATFYHHRYYEILNLLEKVAQESKLPYTG